MLYALNGQNPEKTGSPIFYFALPDCMHTPPEFNQRLLLPPISFYVLLELLAPIVYVRFRETEIARRTPMPEATMDEDSQLPPREGDIRPADVSPIFSIYPPMETITRKTGVSQELPNQ